MVIMFDNPPEPALPPEAGTPTTVTNVSGGVSLDTQRDANIGGDVVGCDKIAQTIINEAPHRSPPRCTNCHHQPATSRIAKPNWSN
jgi:hypothetical protein